MIRDPLYRQIVERLDDLTDGVLFEACANDLLRKDHPTIAPCEGGNDAGLDGVIANRNGTSTQLICTVGQDVIGNLTKSLQSSARVEERFANCILATSQKLTNAKRRGLYCRAKKLGRPLRIIYDRAAIADRLYRDARWLKDLLALTGEPRSLSILPISNRRLSDSDAIGRKSELEHLSSLSSDLVVIGQPGSGKTHLLFLAAKKANGLFVVREDVSGVAADVRALKPRFVIVDDAHSRLPFLKQLGHLRTETQGDFHIVATCWPGQDGEVKSALQLTHQKLFLEALPQREIKEVINSQRIFGPEELLRELLHQSHGKPGLAVTLCRLCWDSQTRDVVFGSALANDVKQSIEPTFGAEAMPLLGFFALGGEGGMSLEAAANHFGKSPLAVKQFVEQLGTAGVLDFTSSNTIVIHPTRLRQAMVCALFRKPPYPDLTPFLAVATDLASAARVLIEAKALGGQIQDVVLKDLLGRLATTSEQGAFEEYVSLGRDEAEWILNTFPDRLDSIAAAALQRSPEKTVHLLLRNAAKEIRDEARSGNTSKAADLLPHIKQWVLASPIEGDEATQRRTTLTNAFVNLPELDRHSRLAIAVSRLALSLKHERTSIPPAEPEKMTLHFGVISRTQLANIASLWRLLFPFIITTPASQEMELTDVFHDWIYPDFHAQRKITKEYTRESRGLAQLMMSELLDASSERWTLHYHLRRYAEALGLRKRIKLDPTAEVLYPSKFDDLWRTTQRTPADNLAEALVKRDPLHVVELLVKIEAEALRSNISYSPWGKYLCEKLSNAATEPFVWIDLLLKRSGSAQFLEPFFKRAILQDREAAESWLTLALENSRLHGLIVSFVISFYSPETSIWKTASRFFEECAGWVQGSILKNAPPDNVKALLRSENAKLSSAIAISMWRASSSHEIDAELFSSWKECIVKFVEDGQVLAKVFASYPDVGVAWVTLRLKEAESGQYRYGFHHDARMAFTALGPRLTVGQRRDLLALLPANRYGLGDLARSLVRGNSTLFLMLLARSELGDLRLAPLEIDNDLLNRSNAQCLLPPNWHEFVILAFDAGFSESEIFRASQTGGKSWCGSISSIDAAAALPFKELLNHEDNRVQRLARMAVDYFEKRLSDHLEAERKAAVRGEFS